jgi:uncharacterized DUF497 family protein
MEFDWDPPKAAKNLHDHHVSFDEACFVFTDVQRIEMLDDREDYGEERWKTIGLFGLVILSVVYTLRGEDDNTYRLISARRASPHEQRQYREIHPRH